MRIRKHAKISPLIYAASSSSLNPEETINSTKLVCQLNQSPWDIITFSSEMSANHPTLSLFYRFNGYGSYTDNGYFNDSNGTTESVTSMKLDDETEHKNINVYENGDYLWSGRIMKWESNEAVGNGNHILSPKKQPAKDNSSNCYGGHPRLKKSSVCSPDEYYYYSGFAPSWGKKRGGDSSRKNGTIATENVDNYINNVTTSNFQMDNGEELDYVDDDKEEVDDENGEETMKKRARKPIKARSLKSLIMESQQAS